MFTLKLILFIGHPPSPIFTCTLVNNSKSVEFIWNDNYNSVNDIDHYTIAKSTSITGSTNYEAPSTSQISVNLVNGVYNTLNVTPFNCGNQPGEKSNFGINLTSMKTLL